MINKSFWAIVTENWKKETDGIYMPVVLDGGADKIDPDEFEINKIDDDEIGDILADLGLG